MKASQAPLPGKVAALLRESRWFVLIAAALYLALILVTFNRGDPGWSHSVAVDQVHNAGGRLGAWIADIMLYLFGVSAFWWVLFLVYAVIWGYRRLDGSSLSDGRPFVVALGGFVVMLVGSVGIEALRFWSMKASLPLAPGGLFGSVISHVAQATFGFMGATLVLLTLFAVGLSLFTGVSWLTVMERIGAALEWVYFRAIELRDRRADARLGEAAAEEREALVEAERRKVDE